MTFWINSCKFKGFEIKMILQNIFQHIVQCFAPYLLGAATRRPFDVFIKMLLLVYILVCIVYSSYHWLFFSHFWLIIYCHIFNLHGESFDFILLSIYHTHFLNAARLKLLNVRRIINYWFWYHNIIGFDNITDVHYKWSFILLNTYTIGFFISTFRLSGLEKWIYNASGFNYHQQLCYCNAVNSILQCSA